MPKIFIDGEAGTTGLQIRERLRGLQAVEVLSIDPAQRKSAEAKKSILQDSDLVILCLHDSAAIETVQLVNDLPGPKPKILDASTAHRTHADWVYGFAELDPKQAERIAASERVANPGCYATGAIALIHPLIQSGLLPPSAPLCLPSVSGYSGGGRAMIAEYESSTLPRFEAYSLGLSHKHLPEIMRYTGLSVSPIFVPSVGGFAQGMLVQLPLHMRLLKAGSKPADVFEVLSTHYQSVCTQHSPLISVHRSDPSQNLSATALAGSDTLSIHVYNNAAQDQVVLFAQFDNLGKGASGAAVQNLKLMLGLNG